MEKNIKKVNSLSYEEFIKFNQIEKQRRNIQNENFVLSINHQNSGIPKENIDQKIKAFIKVYTRVNSPSKIDYTKIQDDFFLKKFYLNLKF